MASPVSAPGCTVQVNVFDGRRLPISPLLEVLYTLRDGNQKQVYRQFQRGASLTIAGLPFFNNFGDLYAVIAWAPGYRQTGFYPVRLAPNAPQQVDLMLLSEDAGFSFGGTWEAIGAKRPVLARLLTAGTASDAAARDRFNGLLENRPAALACLLNLATAMEQIHLRVDTPLDYFQEIIWDDTLAQDRFFGYADARLIGQVQDAAEQGMFAPEFGTALFHPGATRSWKQITFGEANLQLTFHENPEDRRTINGIECVKTEPDIDYYKDLGAHALFEVLANGLAGSLTDPREVYVLRWMAGRRAGSPEFDPLYTLV